MKKILFIHGDLNDIYWGKMKDDEIRKVVPHIIKRIPYNTFVLSNKQYNELYMNLNVQNINFDIENFVSIY